MQITATPVKRTALYRRHLTLGCSLGEHHGWQVAARFAAPEEEVRRVREAVGLSDVSWMGKIEMKGSGLDDGGASTAPPGSLWRLARDHRLATCGTEHREAVLRSAIQAAAAHPCVRVTDVTSVYTALLLAGPRSRDVLRALCALDVSDGALPAGACAQTGLAHAHAIVLRQDAGDVPAFRVLVDRSYGEYVWDAVMHAGRDRGIAPIGLTALRMLGVEC